MLESTWVAWVYYLAGALGLLLFWWRLTRVLTPVLLRRILRAVMVGVLLCPYSIGEGYSDQAPAFLMVLLETLFEGTDAFFRGGPTLLGAIAFAIVISIIWHLIQSRRAKMQAKQQAADKDFDDLLQQSEVSSS